MEALRRLLERLKGMGLWARLFQWGEIKSLLVDANGDLQRVTPTLDNLRQSLQKTESQLEVERADSRNLRENFQQTKGELLALREQQSLWMKDKEELQKKLAALDKENETYLRRGIELKQQHEGLSAQLQAVQSELTRLKAEDEQRNKLYEQSIANFNKLTEGQRKREEEEKNEKHRQEIERLKRLKETWSNHEEHVKSRIKAIAARHAIDYVDKVPFRGNPDNTLRIKEEFIVFDAKSPYGEDLTNFPNYLKTQVEHVIKYVREEDVRKEVFLVVPTNTLDSLEQFEYKLADYTVYVISLDALEPIMLALKKIEEYEFAEQLSPEERENICRVIGKFVHLSKRRIQIDGFFAKQFFELVYRSEADLPKEMLDKVVEFEKSEKLNPPTERRSKQISTRELEGETERLKSEANQKGILTQDSTLSRELNKLPLYTVTKPEDTKDQGNLFAEDR
jgi:hypothetical protein